MADHVSDTRALPPRMTLIESTPRNGEGVPDFPSPTKLNGSAAHTSFWEQRARDTTGPSIQSFTPVNKMYLEAHDDYEEDSSKESRYRLLSQQRNPLKRPRLPSPSSSRVILPLKHTLSEPFFQPRKNMRLTVRTKRNTNSERLCPSRSERSEDADTLVTLKCSRATQFPLTTAVGASAAPKQRDTLNISSEQRNADDSEDHTTSDGSIGSARGTLNTTPPKASPFAQCKLYSYRDLFPEQISTNHGNSPGARITKPSEERTPSTTPAAVTEQTVSTGRESDIDKRGKGKGPAYTAHADPSATEKRVSQAGIFSISHPSKSAGSRSDFTQETHGQWDTRIILPPIKILIDDVENTYARVEDHRHWSEHDRGMKPGTYQPLPTENRRLEVNPDGETCTLVPGPNHVGPPLKPFDPVHPQPTTERIAVKQQLAVTSAQAKENPRPGAY